MKPLASFITKAALVGISFCCLAFDVAWAGSPVTANKEHVKTGATVMGSDKVTSNASDKSADKTQHSTSPANAATLTTDTFVATAVQAGLTEVEVGKLASTNASSDNVKIFAQKMVKDHGSANTELKALAAQKGLTVQATLDAEHQAKVDALKKKTGADFDAAYAKEMASAHEDALRLFTTASVAKNVDPALQTFARNTLPTIRTHRQLADELHAHAQ
jgi:putative membrane protein